ncbi:MAG: hypothetical protein Q7J73_10840 [Dehalococcoidales bacterium]|nr:hypothetical protein [Dehalococcoidales bacterium]
MNHPLYELLEKLDEAHFSFILSRDRPDTITVEIYFVGERVEVDVFDDGHMEVSRFLGTEDVLGGQELIYDILDKMKFENKAWENYKGNEHPS